MIRYFSSFALCVGPAVADEIAFDPTRMEACLVENYEAGTGFLCLGMAAEGCTKGHEGQTEMLVLCNSAEADYWQRQLEEISLYLLQTAATAHEDYIAAPETGAQAQVVLDTGAAHIEAVCEFSVMQWGVGSGAQNAGAYCRARMIGEHVLRLRQLLQQF